MLPLTAILFSTISVTPQDFYDEDTVRDLKLTFHQSNWWNQLDQNRPSESYIKADLEVDGVLYPDVGVRFKGNSSASVWPAEKMPFKIKMDEYVSGQEIDNYNSINLGNSFMDPTFCREVVTYHYLRKFMPAPKANFVKLWLNGTYWGIYTNTQQVNGEFIDDHFLSDDGNRYKCDPVSGGGPGGGDSTLTWQGSGASAYQDDYQLKSDPTGTEWVDLVDLCDDLNNGSISGLFATVEDDLNTDRALWYLAAQNLFVNRDSYIESGHNYYVYHDPVDGRFHTIPWDSNEAFGNFGMGMSITQLQRLSPLENYGGSRYPLITRLLNPSSGAHGRIAYFAHYREMVERIWDWPEIGAKIAEYQTLIEADVISDTKKLYSLSDFYNNVTQDVAIGGRWSCGLKPFVENRRAYLIAHSDLSGVRPDISGVSKFPDDPDETDTVAITADISVAGATLEKAVLMYRSGPAGPYTEVEMLDDGLNGDGAALDGTYGGLIPPQPRGTEVDHYIFAWTTGDDGVHSPWEGAEDPRDYTVRAETQPNGVVLNEFMAKNETVVADEVGEYEDWIEILNATASTVDLSGWFLTDDMDNFAKWAIPAGTTLTSGDTLLVWADEDLGDGPMHANFKLSGDGERLLLVDPDGVTLRDFIHFDEQADDVATARMEDGFGDWVTTKSATPDSLNIPSCGYWDYGPLDPFLHSLTLAGSGSPSLSGGSIDVVVGGLSPGDSLNLYASTASAYLDTLVPDGVALIDPSRLIQTVPLTANGSGQASLSVPISNPGLLGARFYCQAYAPTASLGVGLSNGLQITICP